MNAVKKEQGALLTFLISMRAILWAFLGVRKRSGQDADMASLSFVHIILAAIFGAIVFMTILILIVNAVVKS